MISEMKEWMSRLTDRLLRIDHNVEKLLGHVQENDGIQLFIEEKCIKDPIFTTQRSKMTASIQKFCKKNNYDVPSRNAISDTLKKEFKEGHGKKGDFWCRIKIYDETECQND